MSDESKKQGGGLIVAGILVAAAALCAYFYANDQQPIGETVSATPYILCGTVGAVLFLAGFIVQSKD